MTILITFLSFAENIFGGIERSIADLALGIERCGSRAIVYSSTLGGASEMVSGTKVMRNPILLPPRLPAGNCERDEAIRKHLEQNKIRIAEDLARTVKENHVDAVIACDALWGIVQIVEAWRFIDAPMVMNFHVLNERRLLEAVASTPYFYCSCVSKHLKQEIAEVSDVRISRVFPNSVDLDKFNPAPSHVESNVIFCNSRIDPGKGIPYLLEAFSQFNKLIPGFELWLCGGVSPFGDRDAVFESITQQIEVLGIVNRVRILGNIAWEMIPSCIRGSFAVVLPTLHESFGLAALETLACGVPLIATTVGNLPDLVGDAGMLVEPRSSDAIYAGLIGLYQNEELREKYKRLGPLRAAAYSNSAIASSVIASFM